MNDVLHDPTAKEALDEELWYFLKSLYTDKSGMNLRNLVAHGIAPAGAFHRGTAAPSFRAWCFSLWCEMKPHPWKATEPKVLPRRSALGTDSRSGQEYS